MKNFKYVSIDIETTGLDPATCDIIEFGAVLDDLTDRRPLDNLPIFHCYFQKDSYTGEPFALSMHPHIFRRIAEYKEKGVTSGAKFYSAEKFGHLFKKFLIDNGYTTEHDKVVINAAGKNFASFDLQFLKEKTDFLKHINVRSRILDPGVLFLDAEDDSIPGMSKCKERACLSDTSVAHDAVNDAKDVVNLVRHGLKHVFK